MVHQNNFGAPKFYTHRGKFGKIVRFCPSGSEKSKITCQIIKELELVFPIALVSKVPKISDLMNQGLR
tara:strand:+ start:234 stop:437 length:204 start_codon:yes stop_codon:yes gene_type:complete